MCLMGHSSDFQSAHEQHTAPHALSAMPADEPGRSDHSSGVEAAIESGCGALLAVEASRPSISRAARGRGSAEADVLAAVASLRHAIEELRALEPPVKPSQLALEFVIDPDAVDRPPVQ
jgi:hypothetical protein